MSDETKIKYTSQFTPAMLNFKILIKQLPPGTTVEDLTGLVLKATCGDDGTFRIGN